MGRLRISNSMLHTMHVCPFCYKFRYVDDEVPTRTDYPRILGIVIHRIIAKFYGRQGQYS